jgi:hypothetical protein
MDLLNEVVQPGDILLAIAVLLRGPLRQSVQQRVRQTRPRFPVALSVLLCYTLDQR